MKKLKNLLIIAMAALAFNACEDVPAPYTLPGENAGGSTLPEGVYIDANFANNFGTFTTAETEGNYPWIIDYSTAKATSYIDNQNNPAQSWLISAPVDFTNETEAYVSFDYIIRYAESGKVADNHQLLVSTDYAGDPAAATWINIDYGATEGTDWQTFYKANVSVPEEIMGKPGVTFALKYTAKSKAGTWEVKNFVVAHGKGDYNTESGDYINETFSQDFGAFTLAQTVGNYPWIIDYSTAKATSYVDNQNNPAQSWLISPKVDFTNETEAYVSFDYIIRYAESGKVADNHQLLVSTDYAGDPAAATWINIDYGATEGTDWQTFYKANVSVPEEIMGKPGVTFALKYTAESKAGTWEVKNFVVAHGTPTEQEKPQMAEYTVNEALAAYTDGKQLPAIVTGYIVGSIDGKSISDGAIFGATTTAETNLLIAASADETDVNSCIPVQLPSGAVRTALNLKNNPGNYKKQVKLTGSIEKYFGVAGLKSVSEYEFIEEGGSTDEPVNPDGISSISSVIAAGGGSATIQGTIIATYARGFLVNDNTGTILVYLGEDKGFSAGDVVTVSGETTVYGGLLQFGNTSTATKTGTATVSKPTATKWNGADLDAYLNAPQIKYVEYTGKLSISGYYNVTVDGASNAVGSIAYPKDGLVDASLNGKAVKVTGYAIGVSGSIYVNTMAVSVVAVDAGTSDDQGGNDNEDSDGNDSATTFDFTNPTALTPSVTPSDTPSNGVEFDEITFTNNGYSIYAATGTASNKVRIWTKTGGNTELRTYKGSSITVSAPEGSTLTNIKFNGNKVSTMTADSGTFDAGTWSGTANSVTFSVTGTLYITSIEVK